MCTLCAATATHSDDENTDASSIVQLLLESGADANANDSSTGGITPLMLAKTAAVTKLLLAAGADATAVEEGWLPVLHHQAKAGASAGSICLLLKAGADPTISDSCGHGITPAHVAGMHGHFALEALLSRAADEYRKRYPDRIYSNPGARCTCFSKAERSNSAQAAASSTSDVHTEPLKALLSGLDASSSNSNNNSSDSNSSSSSSSSSKPTTAAAPHSSTVLSFDSLNSSSAATSSTVNSVASDANLYSLSDEIGSRDASASAGIFAKMKASSIVDATVDAASDHGAAATTTATEGTAGGSGSSSMDSSAVDSGKVCDASYEPVSEQQQQEQQQEERCRSHRAKQPCANCHKLTSKLCRACAVVYYCSVNCQKVCFSDAQHRAQCVAQALKRIR
jgi:Ankyrin repeat